MRYIYKVTFKYDFSQIKIPTVDLVLIVDSDLRGPAKNPGAPVSFGRINK